MNIELERKLIESFVMPEKRERYLDFIQKEKTRKKFLNELYHFKDFNWILFEEIQGNQNERNVILEKLANKKNSSGCYVISANENFDRKTVSVKDCMEQIVGVEGTIIIFGEGDVVYYEGEAPHNRFISK
ncbi:MAG: hypothetical protein ACHQFX_14530 [Chitinophagales bacterium]